MSDWIDCKHKLPPDDKYVLVWQTFFAPGVNLARHWGEGLGWHMSQITGDVSENVTHWMPMPAPPVESPTVDANAVAIHEMKTLQQAKDIVRSYYDDAKPVPYKDGRWTMQVGAAGVTQLGWSASERELWIDLAIWMSPEKPSEKRHNPGHSDPTEQQLTHDR